MADARESGVNGMPTHPDSSPPPEEIPWTAVPSSFSPKTPGEQPAELPPPPSDVSPTALPTPTDWRSLGAVIASAVVITLLVTSCMPIVGHGLAAVVAVVFGILGVRSRQRGWAITAIAIGGVVIVGVLLVFVLYGALIASTLQESGL